MVGKDERYDEQAAAEALIAVEGTYAHLLEPVLASMFKQNTSVFSIAESCMADLNYAAAVVDADQCISHLNVLFAELVNQRNCDICVGMKISSPW